MPPLIEGFVTNLGKYNEGALVGEYLKFPTTAESVEALLKRIGIDGVLYEEIFISDYSIDIPGLYDCLGEYESIDELNHLACLLSELDEADIIKFAAAVDEGSHTSSVAELINLAENLDCYGYYPGVTTAEELGRIYIDDFGRAEFPEELRDYIDYEAYGRDMSINEGGHFTKDGYLIYEGGFKEVYHGREDIPPEHRVFSMPKLSIREQMAAYKDMPEQTAPEKPAPTQGHDDR